MIYFRIFLITIVIGLICSVPILFKKWRDAEHRSEQLAKYAKSKSEDATFYKNALGQQVIKKEVVTLDRKAFNQIHQDFSYLQQEFSGIKKNLKNIEQITKLTTSVRDTLVLANRDTLVMNQQAVVFSYEDEWNYAKGLVFKDTTILDLKIEVPVDLIVLWERKKILGLKIGKKEFTAHATSNNKSAIISGLENINIEKR